MKILLKFKFAQKETCSIIISCYYNGDSKTGAANELLLQVFHIVQNITLEKTKAIPLLRSKINLLRRKLFN